MRTVPKPHPAQFNAMAYPHPNIKRGNEPKCISAPDERAKESQHERLGDHQTDDAPGRGAERQQHPELAGALEDRQRHGVRDSEHRDTDREGEQPGRVEVLVIRPIHDVKAPEEVVEPPRAGPDRCQPPRLGAHVDAGPVVIGEGSTPGGEGTAVLGARALDPLDDAIGPAWAPDGRFRWLPAIAADGAGNVAIGYSIGDATTYPSLAVAGRLATDAPGLLTQGETIVQAGSGSQTTMPSGAALTRWGDYASMTVDPAARQAFYARVKGMPAVAGVALQEVTLRNFRETMAETMNLQIFFNVLFMNAFNLLAIQRMDN